MRSVIALALLVLCGACRDEQSSGADGGVEIRHITEPVQTQVIYRDVDRHHDEHSALDTYLQIRMWDSLWGNDRRDVHHYHSTPTVVHHETVVHHVTPSPAPAPAPKASSSWWGSSSTKTTTTRTTTTTSAPSAPKPSYSPPKSSSYGFKSSGGASSSRPVTFRASPSRSFSVGHR